MNISAELIKLLSLDCVEKKALLLLKLAADNFIVAKQV